VTLISWQITAEDRLRRADALDLEPVVYTLTHPGPGEAGLSLAQADWDVSLYRCFLKLCILHPGTAPSAAGSPPAVGSGPPGCLAGRSRSSPPSAAACTCTSPAQPSHPVGCPVTTSPRSGHHERLPASERSRRPGGS
jgi:hypothetical protein